MIKARITPADPRLEAVLDRLRHLHPKLIDLSLGRIERLLSRLGHPERRLPPVVHVAGTNGKGSTVAFLRAMLEAAGYRVHVYTSPHLVHFRERIRLAGRLIDDERLVDHLTAVERANRDDPITFFEVTTAAAFLAFAEVPADVALLEVGLGGRLDATNVVDAPAVSVLTRISFDHMQFLGDSLAEIAWEKAGILKAGRPAVAAPQSDPVVERVFAERADALSAPLRLAGRDWRVRSVGDGLRFEDPAGGLVLPPPGLVGPHQVVNAGLAVAALRCLPLPVAQEAMAAGLQRVEWPARLQRLTRGPMPARLPAAWELWLDGGHNDSAGEVLAQQARAWAADPSGPSSRPLDVVFGMLASKRPQDFLGPLAPAIRRLRTVAIEGEDASLPADAAAESARALGVPDVSTAADVGSALDDLGAAGGPPARVLICGSLYLAGTVLRDNG